MTHLVLVDFFHNMGLGDLWIYIDLHLYVSFRKLPSTNLLMVIEYIVQAAYII